MALMFARGSRAVAPSTASDAVHGAFMTRHPYTQSREGEGHELGLGVRSCLHSARSDPVEASRERIERACEGTSAPGTARCASRGKFRHGLPPERDSGPQHFSFLSLQHTLCSLLSRFSQRNYRNKGKQADSMLPKRYWWRSRYSRLAFHDFRLKASVVFDLATSTQSGHEPIPKCTTWRKHSIMTQSRPVPLVGTGLVFLYTENNHQNILDRLSFLWYNITSKTI